MSTGSVEDDPALYEAAAPSSKLDSVVEKVQDGFVVWEVIRTSIGGRFFLAKWDSVHFGGNVYWGGGGQTGLVGSSVAVGRSRRVWR